MSMEAIPEELRGWQAGWSLQGVSFSAHWPLQRCTLIDRFIENKIDAE